ncbi:MAG TPA: ectonucleotide pyrophosphatase/phosphodiesterase [Tepidisphaeraceae bacterium]|nr:ectonucleotide pyrophosphatase/phosphodiesterase [Tepidisphaeraceae bacterium]
MAPFRLVVAIIVLYLALPVRGQPSSAPADSSQQAIDRRHVLIISIDGLRPDIMLRANTPNLRKLMNRGSFSMWAKTTPQSITLPSHVSMVTGVNPNAHGIQWNSDLPLAKPVFSSYPTLFQLAKRAGYSTALVTGKSKLVSLTPPESLDWSWVSPDSSSDDSTVAERAIELYSRNRPDVFFVHFPTTDNVGHAIGWGTDEQLNAVEAADAAVGRIIDSIEPAQRTGSTLIIISADHGGAGRTHGTEDARSRYIPWIAVGPGVRANYDLTRFGANHEVQTYDTFSTACYFLNITPPKRVEGKPIREMFDDAELTRPDAPKPRLPTTQEH